MRLLGIDTPEIHVEDGPPECFGPEAAAFTASLLPAGTEVRLERDVVGRDHYGRLLAHVYRRADGLFVNEAILRKGYAQPLTIEPNHVVRRALRRRHRRRRGRRARSLAAHAPDSVERRGRP